MSGRYSLAVQGVTLVAVANAANFTDAGYPFFLQGGSSTQRLIINEVQAGGESTSSAVCSLIFGRDSTVAATGISGGTNALMDATSTAPGTVAVFGNTSTTKPQRSSTLGHLLQHSFNAFGGLVRWQARQGEEISTYGNTASLGEVSYSLNTGGAGIVSAHLIYEVA
jgi:hypothetical protein